MDQNESTMLNYGIAVQKELPPTTDKVKTQ